MPLFLKHTGPECKREFPSHRITPAHVGTAPLLLVLISLPLDYVRWQLFPKKKTEVATEEKRSPNSVVALFGYCSLLVRQIAGISRYYGFK